MNPPARCPHCQQDTLVLIRDGADPSGHCTNRRCNGFYVTLPMSQYRALTAAQLAAYQTGRAARDQQDVEQSHFDERVAAVVAAAEARRAARQPCERLFG